MPSCASGRFDEGPATALPRRYRAGLRRHVADVTGNAFPLPRPRCLPMPRRSACYVADTPATSAGRVRPGQDAMGMRSGRPRACTATPRRHFAGRMDRVARRLHSEPANVAGDDAEPGSIDGAPRRPRLPRNAENAATPLTATRAPEFGAARWCAGNQRHAAPSRLRVARRFSGNPPPVPNRRKRPGTNHRQPRLRMQMNNYRKADLRQ